MQETIKKWSVLEIIKATETALKEKGISKPRLNAELLLADTLNTQRINLYIDFDKPLTQAEISSFREKIKRRLKNEPLQYITGKCGFFGLDFIVNPSVLIPRQETEQLVERTLEEISGNDRLKIMEIGTGSGCIAVSLAANSTNFIEAIDISEEALDIAIENAEINKVNDRIKFSKKNILTDYNDFSGYGVIVSNPPYIEAAEIENLDTEVKDFEPMDALTDGKDGLEFYRKIFSLASKTANPLTLLLEIGDGKKDAVQKVLNEMGFENYIFHKDLINIYRVLIIKTKGQNN